MKKKTISGQQHAEIAKPLFEEHRLKTKWVKLSTSFFLNQRENIKNLTSHRKNTNQNKNINGLPPESIFFIAIQEGSSTLFMMACSHWGYRFQVPVYFLEVFYALLFWEPRLKFPLLESMNAPIFLRKGLPGIIGQGELFFMSITIKSIGTNVRCISTITLSTLPSDFWQRNQLVPVNITWCHGTNIQSIIYFLAIAETVEPKSRIVQHITFQQ